MNDTLRALFPVTERANYLNHAAVRERVRTTLQHLNDRTAQERGFFYHFLDSATGERAWRSEAWCQSSRSMLFN